MKKVILSLVGVIAFASVTLAQGFHIGAKAGANLGKINGQDFEDGFKLGYQLGGFAEIDFTKGFGIQPEVLWSQTNTTVTDEDRKSTRLNSSHVEISYAVFCLKKKKKKKIIN